MNIVRVKLPNGIARFEPFTVKDYRDLLLVRNEMKSCPDERQEILDQLLEELYPQYSKIEREYIFLNVFIASIGKSKIDLSFNCPTCDKKVRFRLDISQPPLVKPRLKINNITFNFRMPERAAEPDELFLETIESVDDGTNEYQWQDIPQYHDALIEMISFDDFAELSKKFSSINIHQTVTCCSVHHIHYTGLLDLFELLLDPNEVFSFYRINRLLAKHDYSMSDVMQMLPIERSIALTLVDKELKDKK